MGGGNTVQILLNAAVFIILYLLNTINTTIIQCTSIFCFERDKDFKKWNL